jgi:L-ascorbate metabolism protein UlaG (beta-lactamase superfamily)
LPRLAITWFGHSTFLLGTPGGLKVLVDPWFTGNPVCPPALARPPKADLILVSHGHEDHVGDAVLAARESGAPTAGPYELCQWLAGKGVKGTEPLNVGGTWQHRGLDVTLTEARHSSSTLESGRVVYLGEPAGFLVRVEDGLSLYYAGDTALFSDMRLIAERWHPTIAFLPIGDRFTMGPADAATAARWLGVRQVVPMHWGTWPSLTGTPDMLRAALSGTGVDVLELRPGETAE